MFKDPNFKPGVGYRPHMVTLLPKVVSLNRAENFTVEAYNKVVAKEKMLKTSQILKYATARIRCIFQLQSVALICSLHLSKDFVCF